MKVYTIGHSTRSFESLLNLLRRYGIDLVIDVRRFPTSKRFPHFNKDELERNLERNGIKYIHFPKLGGFREEGYEAYSKSEEFKEAIEELRKVMENKTPAILCSELLWFRCHRRYIAEVLVNLGYPVIHILDEKRVQVHEPKDKDVQEKMKLKVYCDKMAKRLTKQGEQIT